MGKEKYIIDTIVDDFGHFIDPSTKNFEKIIRGGAIVELIAAVKVDKFLNSETKTPKDHFERLNLLIKIEKQHKKYGHTFRRNKDFLHNLRENRNWFLHPNEQEGKTKPDAVNMELIEKVIFDMISEFLLVVMNLKLPDPLHYYKGQSSLKRLLKHLEDHFEKKFVPDQDDEISRDFEERETIRKKKKEEIEVEKEKEQIRQEQTKRAKGAEFKAAEALRRREERNKNEEEDSKKKAEREAIEGATKTGHEEQERLRILEEQREEKRLEEARRKEEENKKKEAEKKASEQKAREDAFKVRKLTEAKTREQKAIKKAEEEARKWAKEQERLKEEKEAQKKEQERLRILDEQKEVNRLREVRRKEKEKRKTSEEEKKISLKKKERAEKELQALREQEGVNWKWSGGYNGMYKTPKQKRIIRRKEILGNLLFVLFLGGAAIVILNFLWKIYLKFF